MSFVRDSRFLKGFICAGFSGRTYDAPVFTEIVMKEACFSVLALLAAGCSGLGIGSEEYGCAGLPEGTQCHSAREVYQQQGRFAGAGESAENGDSGIVPAPFPKTSGSGDFRQAEFFGKRLYRYPEDVVITVINGYTDRDGTAHSASTLLHSLDNGYWYRTGEIRNAPESAFAGELAEPAPEGAVPVPFRNAVPAKPARQ